MCRSRKVDVRDGSGPGASASKAIARELQTVACRPAEDLVNTSIINIIIIIIRVAGVMT